MILLLACSDHGLSVIPAEVVDDVPQIVVNPLTLDFWSVASGETASLTVTVTNVGVTTLEVATPTIDGVPSFTTTASASELSQSTSQTIDVVFAPLAPESQSADLVIQSNDPETPEVRVALTGSGRVPQLQISPDPWDFGTLPPGCAESITLTLQNIGNDDLLIEAVSLSIADFSLVTEELPLTLTPFAYTSAELTYSPSAEGESTNTLSVYSNDPRGVVTATEFGAGSATEARTETFTVDEDPPVDLLFAIDRSGSMDDDAVALAGAFVSFIAAIEAQTTGWHLGVVTLDDGCFNGGVLDTDSPDLAATFAEAVVTGDDRDLLYDEALFQLIDLALVESSGCNAGFLRSGALFHTIVVTDEPERSTEQASAWTWDWYHARWLDHVASPELLRVSGVVDTDGCNEGYRGYDEAITATGGEALSLCAGDWGAVAADLAEASLGSLWSFPLAEEPVAASIVVTVDSVASTTWSWDEGRNVVSVDELQGGEQVEISYLVAPECP